MTLSSSSDLRDDSQRRFMLILLALNLFLAGIIGAFVIRSYFGEHPPHRRGGPIQRIEMIATRLPPSDANVLREEFTKQADAIAQASDAFRQARERTKRALRTEPFDAGAARIAMAEAGTNHQESERLFQEVIVSAAARMTREGRRILADWPPRPGSSSEAAGSPFSLVAGSSSDKRPYF